MITLTDLELERIAEKFCDLVQKSVERYYNTNLSVVGCDPCDLCPMTDLCSKGKTGIIEFLKNKGGIYGDKL